MLAVGQTEITKSREGCLTNTDGSLTCTPATLTSDGQARFSLDSNGTALTDASIFAAAGLLWHFLERPRQRAVAITPLVGPSLAGLTLDARF